jgi:hypothetical protein
MAFELMQALCLGRTKALRHRNHPQCVFLVPDIFPDRSHLKFSSMDGAERRASVHSGLKDKDYSMECLFASKV